MSHEPPLVVLGFGQRANGTAKDTLVNIQDTGEFVINLVDTKLAEPMSHCGIDAPSDIDELEATGLDTAPSHVVRPPRIKSAPASLECRLVDQHHYGKREHAAIVIGQIEHLFVREGLINERFHVDQDLLDLVGRMAGYSYVRTTDRFSLKGTALGQKQGVQV